MKKILKILCTLLVTTTLFLSHAYTTQKAEKPEETEEVEAVEAEEVEAEEEAEPAQEEPAQEVQEEEEKVEETTQEAEEVVETEAAQIQEEAKVATEVESTEESPFVKVAADAAADETAEAKPEKIAPIKPVKRQLTIEKPKKPSKPLPSDPEGIIERAIEDEKKIQDIENKIESEIAKMQAQQRALDNELDAFHKQRSAQLATFNGMANEIKKYLDKEVEPSDERAKLEMIFKNFTDKKNIVALDMEEVQTREETLHPQFKNLSEIHVNISLSSAQSRKLKGEIKNSPSQELLAKLQAALGAVTNAEKNFGSLKATVDKQIKTINDKVATVAKTVTELQTDGKKLSAQIEKVGKAQAQEAKKSEDEAIKKITAKLQKAKHGEIVIQLRWYEKIVASLAKAIIKARNKIRKTTGITPQKQTSGTIVGELEEKIKQLEKQKTFAMKVQKKLNAIEKQKQELLQKLHAKENSKAAGILHTTYEFFKDIFLKIGSTINRGLENAATMGEKKKSKAKK